MAGRERIPVAANDTLERVLDRLRSSQAEEIVLDVDGRSPLLSVPNLDTLEETAQHQGVRITIASTSSKILSAARVFGIPVIDTTAAPAPARTRPDPHARLLAGEPLGDADAPVLGGVAVADAAPGDAARPAAHPAPVIAFQTVTVGDEQEAEDPAEGRDEPERAPRTTRLRLTPATPGDETAQPRLDPYGQPYLDEPEEEEDLPPRRTRRRAAAAPPASIEHAEEGWDDALTVDDEPGEGYRDEPRPGLFGGLRSLWADVRERVAARRRPELDDEPYDEDEADEPGEDKGEEGWDEPPYRARMARSAPARAAAPVAPAEDPEIGDDTGELPEPVPARPARLIRPLDNDRIDTARQPTARLRPVPAPYDADTDDLDDDGEEYEEADARRRVPAGLLVWALIALLAVGLVGVLVAYVLVPRATVTLVARTGTPEIGFNVVVGEIDPNSPQGQANDERIVVPARRIIVPVNASASKSATGTRLEPDLTAGGPVIVTNASTEATGLPKGTVLTATDGRTYVTLDPVTVPPIDPFASSALGTATVKVAAQTPGSAGNAPIGVVRGQIGSSLFYSNRDAPIAGGSDKRISTITKQDLADAQAAAETAARGKWQAAVNAAIPAGSQAMRDTAGLGAFRVEFSAREGADGASVSATVAADATVLVYSMAEVEASARTEAEGRIARAAPPGETLIPGSVQLGTPQLAAEVPGTLTYRMTATARSRALIGSEAERAQLADDLAHLSDDEAHDLLARLPGVSSATIDYDTGPFPRRLPWRAKQIKVVVAER